MKDAMKWLANNRQWVFSGIGVFVLGLVIPFFYHAKDIWEWLVSNRLWVFLFMWLVALGVIGYFIVSLHKKRKAEEAWQKEQQESFAADYKKRLEMPEAKIISINMNIPKLKLETPVRESTVIASGTASSAFGTVNGPVNIHHGSPMASEPASKPLEQVRVDVSMATISKKQIGVTRWIGENKQKEETPMYERPAQLKVFCYNLEATPVVIEEIILSSDGQEIKRFHGNGRLMEGFKPLELDLEIKDDEAEYPNLVNGQSTITIKTVRGGAFYSKAFNWTPA